MNSTFTKMKNSKSIRQYAMWNFNLSKEQEIKSDKQMVLGNNVFVRSLWAVLEFRRQQHAHRLPQTRNIRKPPRKAMLNPSRACLR